VPPAWERVFRDAVFGVLFLDVQMPRLKIKWRVRELWFKAQKEGGKWKKWLSLGVDCDRYEEA